MSKALKGFAAHDDEVCDGMRGALCSHQDPSNCNRERDCPAFVALPKTTAERVAKMRADSDSLGLKRLELYAHPEDWPAIKALAEKLQRRRRCARKVMDDVSRRSKPANVKLTG